MNFCRKLGLGTVQWGMPYGIANKIGRPEIGEVGQILELARKFGLTTLDTAHGYGDAELVVGRHQEILDAFKIVTKTQPIRREPGVTAVISAFGESMGRLGLAKIYGLLVHREEDLLSGEGAQLWACLQELKAQGLVLKIGVSVYMPDQLGRILDCYPVDIVQLPLNLYDQRFLRSEIVDRLSLLGVEVHARSCFLQGLLLLPTEQLPEQFSTIRIHHERFHRECEKLGITPLEGSVRFCLAQPKVDQVIVGCETQDQLREILDVASGGGACLEDTESFALEKDDPVIDPRRWLK